MKMGKRARQRLSGHTYKALFKLGARKTKKPDTTHGAHDSEADLSNKVHVSYPEKQRVSFNMRQVNLCKAGRIHDNKVGVEADLHLELTDCNESQRDKDIVSQHQKCATCMKGGTLLCCNGQGCRRSFHLSCVNPPFTYAPPGVWHCIWCNERKIKFGLYSVSEGIESILDAREVVSDDEDVQRQKQYLVKYKGLAHVHNRWIPESQLVSEAPEFSTKFKRNFQITKKNIEWSVPHRLLDKRLIKIPGHDSSGSEYRHEWLVKWKGLSYNDTTWESEKASFLRTPEAMKLIRFFESRRKKFDRGSHPPNADEGRKHSFTELSELPLQGSPDILNCNLVYVNKLREYRHRGQNALVIDDQERVVKVVLFILSFQGDLKQPFLIITPSSALSLWEAEFSHWASYENIVVYQGSSDIRTTIRTLEFYNEGGCIMFQVLLSPLEVVIEDLEMLEPIKWEAIVIDECQRPRISENLKHIKMLTADMRLLLVSREIQDRRFNYQAALSLLDLKFDEHALDIDSNFDICNLKERLAHFVAFERKSGTSKFAEYWVPVRLSNGQIEQYCDSLLSNTVMLCSSSKNDSVDSLRELLTLTRKCCDHPYLVDHSVQSFLTTGLPEADNLDVGINLSGKLQLLDKILAMIKKRSLRVLIIFQSLGGSGPISSIGDILADFVHQRFGQDSYTRIDREVIRLKRGARFNIFNQEESGKFVCLIESRACRSSIKCSSVDIVILFDSDWNPMNDIRALQKVKIDSQFEPLKVLRLYSSFTVEEQILILAKKGVTLDGNIESINRSTCHILLNWGAHYLFDKLDIMHSCRAPNSRLNNWSEESLLEDVFLELSAILPNKSEASDPTSCSIISCVQQTEGAYTSNILLLGEVQLQSMENFILIKQFMDKEPPHAFWTNLLEGREHRWKYLPGPSARKRKTVQYPIRLPEGFDSEVNPVENKRSKVVSNTANITSLTVRLTNKRKVPAPVEDGHVAGVSEPSGNNSKCLTCSTNNVHYSNHASDPLSMPHVSNDVSVECNGGDEVTLGENITQVEQHSEATTPISGETPSDPSLPAAQLHISPSQLSLSLLHQPPNSPHPPTEIPRQPVVEELPGLSDSSVVQLVPNLPPQLSTEITVVGSQSEDLCFRSTNSILEHGNNHPQQISPMTSEVLQHTRLNPLQMELEIIKKNEEQAIKAHEDTKSRLKSDSDKEIAEIQKKYDALLQEADMTLMQQRRDLETRYRIVCMNELLAKALIKKNDTANQPSSLGLQKEATVSSFLDIMAQLCVQPTTTVTTPGIEQSSASPLSHPMNQSEQMVNQTPVVYPDVGRMIPRIEQSWVSLPMAGPPTVTPCVQVEAPSSEFQQAAPSTGLHIQWSSASLLMTSSSPVTPPMQAMIHSTPVLQNAVCTPQFDQSPAGQIIAYPSATMAMQSVSHGSVLLANSARPVNIPTIQCSSNLSAGNSLRARAPAPHLRYSRPPSYVSAPNFPTLPNLLPVLHSTINSQPTSGHPAYQSGSITGIYRLECAGGAPIHGSILAPEPPMGVNYLSGPDFQNQFFPLQSMGRNYRAI